MNNMGSKVKQMDEYVCAEMIKSDIELNYDNFYKDDLIRLLKVCRKLYKEVQEINEEAIDFIEKNRGMISKFTFTKTTYAQEELTIDQLDDLLEILKRNK